jgi:outer membrane receptor for ferrienterochelin and colicins
MYYRIVLVFLYFIISFSTNGQRLTGTIIGTVDTTEAPLPYVSVFWINTAIATSTDSIGKFTIPIEGITDNRLVVRSVGYISDTVDVNMNEQQITIRLATNIRTLKEVLVKGKPRGFDDPIKTEIINKDELSKAACCDLAGCFETQATIQPMTTNIITNSKELRILGLSGVYNQVLIDGMPLIQGLSYTYGISGLPGTLVDNIYVAKGANSVLQGYESISGSINVITKQPDKTDKLFLNVYMNSFWEKHVNANYSKRWNKWSTLTAFHMVQPAGKFDRDQDDFRDVPKLTRYMLYNKWKYRDEDSIGWSSMIGLRYLNEERIGGQTFFTKAQRGDTSAYGQVVNFQQPEVYTKTGYRFSDTKKATLIASSFLQAQNSYFGTIHYNANQYNAYANAQYEWTWNDRHDLKTGASLRYMNLNETISFSEQDTISRTYGGKYLKEEIIPGVFVENVFKWRGDKYAWITGARVDHHNRFGFFFTPRTQFKYEITEGFIARLSSGTGWRTINLFSENINLLASSRDVVVTETLRPEQAFNWGINLSKNVDGEKISGVFSLDYYQTRFSNQIFPDYDSDPTKAYISNFTGTSVSNGFQIESNLKFYERFTAKLAYTFLDVFRIEAGKKNVLPFNSRHKAMGSFSYKPLTKAWHADVNAHWYGEQRLPDTESNPEEYRRPDKSAAYTITSAQFTKVWDQFELYFGCENIFDFRQKRPILGWQNPFSPYFDSSFAWGPTRGRELYVGVRFKIK